MGTPQIQTNRLNMGQGRLPEVENTLLYVGQGTTNAGKVVAIGADTDLDEICGKATSTLKTQLKAAKVNAGQNWQAYVVQLSGDSTWSDAVELAVTTEAKIEGVVITDPVSKSTDVDAIYAKQKSILLQYRVPLFFIVAIRAIDSTAKTGETWAEYATAIKAIQENVLADTVSLCPYLWPDMVGTYSGRLCNRSVTVADSPMRTKTGTLVGKYSTRPVDKNGRILDLGILKDLSDNRFSVPWWYPQYDGTYFADGMLLDAAGGDYQVIEHLRVMQKIQRKIYPLIVRRIADRILNSTPLSIAQNKNYFMRPVREMAKDTKLLGIVFPGEIHSPEPSDIKITWTSKTEVTLGIAARPYNCPKKITCNLMLDLRNLG